MGRELCRGTELSYLFDERPPRIFSDPTFLTSHLSLKISEKLEVLGTNIEVRPTLIETVQAELSTRAVINLSANRSEQNHIPSYIAAELYVSNTGDWFNQTGTLLRQRDNLVYKDYIEGEVSQSYSRIRTQVVQHECQRRGIDPATIVDTGEE